MIGAGSTLVVATRNRGKTKEFREAFALLGVTVRDLNDTDGVPPIEETGSTFAENAMIKAKEAAEALRLPVLADDSGLCVDALGGEPGVYSARYAGEGATDADNNAKLLRELLKRRDEGTLKDVGGGYLSSARFVSSLVLYRPDDGRHMEAEGTVEGFILPEARGNGGFGYDPLFWLPEFGKSMAELTVEEKNAISHRGRALQKLLNLLSARR
ncbi:XTP/dITP diphosphatase [Cohnella pontilimi]|uniref:dITP/XTP pyrophosphatase n=1 Tax=Cohnella pontilimi TaxID=2564100 RepID=A0A4U0F9N9_9BACL|nr:XTP/dITP diphosphatase [Cohnella pontilimi]TJY41476.1 XTP/dITP diphosphatase [Cohnella pontilimi]